MNWMERQCFFNALSLWWQMDDETREAFTLYQSLCLLSFFQALLTSLFILMMTKSTQFGFSGSSLQPHAPSSITQTHFGAFVAHILKSPTLTEFTCPSSLYKHLSCWVLMEQFHVWSPPLSRIYQCVAILEFVWSVLILWFSCSENFNCFPLLVPTPLAFLIP